MRKLIDLVITDENDEYIYFTITSFYKPFRFIKGKEVREDCFRYKRTSNNYNYHCDTGEPYYRHSIEWDAAVTAMFQRKYRTLTES